MKKKTKAEKKISKVYREFKAGTLKSSSGQPVTNPKQALAIALSEAGIKRKDEWYEDKSDAYFEGYMSGIAGVQDDDGEGEGEGEEEMDPDLAVKKKELEIEIQKIELEALKRKAAMPESQMMEDSFDATVQDEMFSDKTLHSAVVSEAKKKFEVYPSRYAGYWISQEYERRYKEKHGSMSGAYKGKKNG